MLKFQFEVVHNYTDNDNEESSYELKITYPNGSTLNTFCDSISKVGELVKETVISELIGEGCY